MFLNKGGGGGGWLDGHFLIDLHSRLRNRWLMFHVCFRWNINTLLNIIIITLELKHIYLISNYRLALEPSRVVPSSASSLIAIRSRSLLTLQWTTRSMRESKENCLPLIRIPRTRRLMAGESGFWKRTRQNISETYTKHKRNMQFTVIRMPE